PSDQADPEYPDARGRRADGRDLIAEWKRRHPGGTYAWNAVQLAAAPADGPLLGLCEPSHMQYEHDRPNDPAGEPSLAEMTRRRTSDLRKDAERDVQQGDADRTDHGHHDGDACRPPGDTIALLAAVDVARRMNSPDD